MAGLVKVLVRAAEKKTRTAVEVAGHVVLFEPGNWLEIGCDEDEEEDLALELSRKLKTTTLLFEINTVVDLVWIRAWHAGKQVRELGYAEEGWFADEGKPLPDEVKAPLLSWTKKRRLVAGRDGFEILDCVLGTIE